MAVDRTRLPRARTGAGVSGSRQSRRRVLANGLRVWTVEHRAVPVISFLLLLPAGAADDPPERPGLAAITGDMLDEGCGELDAIELHEALGRHRRAVSTPRSGPTRPSSTLTMLARFADRGVALLADMVAPAARSRRTTSSASASCG